MWNQSSGASIGALLQNLAQTNPRVLQQIMQIMQQRQQQGVGGIGSLPQPGAGGPMPMGRPDLAHYLNNPNLAGNARDAIMGRPSNMAYQVGAFYPPELSRFPMPDSGSSDLAYRVGRDGPMPMGGLWGMTGQQPTSPLPYGQRFNTTPDAPALARMPTSYDGGRTYQMETVNTGSKFYPPSGPKQYGPTQPSYTMPTGPKSYGTPEPYTAPTGPKYMPPTGPKAWGTPQPYAAPTGPKYMPPTGPKVYGQTMPAEQPPAFTAPSQPKVYNPMPVVGDGTTGLDWYAQQAGN